MALARRTQGLKARLFVLFVLLTCPSLVLGQQKIAKEAGTDNRQSQPEPMSLTTNIDPPPASAQRPRRQRLKQSPLPRLRLYRSS
jgi:hypothetical protein